MANMLAAKGRKKRKPRTQAMAAPKRRRRMMSAMPAPKRRRKSKPKMLSAGGGVQAIVMQAGLAIAGGMAGKIARNFLPTDMNPYVKAGIISAGGIAIAYATRQPLIGAGMIGSAGAYAAAAVGQQLNIPLLAERSQANFVRLQEGGREIFADRNGKPLRRVGNQFYDSIGRLTNFKPSDFRAIATI